MNDGSIQFVKVSRDCLHNLLVDKGVEKHYTWDYDVVINGKRVAVFQVGATSPRRGYTLCDKSGRIVKDKSGETVIAEAIREFDIVFDKLKAYIPDDARLAEIEQANMNIAAIYAKDKRIVAAAFKLYDACTAARDIFLTFNFATDQSRDAVAKLTEALALADNG
jgi:hypothetical protein